MTTSHSRPVLSAAAVSLLLSLSLASLAETPPPAAPTAAAAEKTTTAAPAEALTPEQREKFSQLSRQMMEHMREQREFHQSLHELATSEAFDEKTLRERIRAQQKVQEDNIVQSAKAINDFYKTLTPEQRKHLQTMRERMQEHRRDAMKDRRNERMSPPPQKDDR